MGHVYTKKTFISEFSTNAAVYNIYFSDRDDIRTVIEQNNVDKM